MLAVDARPDPVVEGEGVPGEPAGIRRDAERLPDALAFHAAVLGISTPTK